MPYESLLWQAAGLSAKKKKINKKPFLLTQGNCAVIDTTKILLNGSVVIDIPGCTKMTFFQSFKSVPAQAVWKANQGNNPLFAPTPPLNPNASGLLVVQNALGKVETMTPFDKGTKFRFANTPVEGGSKFYLTTRVPGYKNEILYMNLLSPVTEVSIPGNVFGGTLAICTYLNQTQQRAASIEFTAISNQTYPERIEPKELTISSPCRCALRH